MLKPAETISIPVGDVHLSVPVETVTRLLLEKFSRGGASSVTPQDNVPRIGTAWHGGIYAGVVRGRDGAPDYHLIVGPEKESNEGWDKAMKWASSEGEDWTLPFRAEQSVMFGNVPELFKKEYYWSCEQRASDADFAWCQVFDYGTQISAFKSLIYIRARAVRRLAIQ